MNAKSILVLFIILVTVYTSYTSVYALEDAVPVKAVTDIEVSDYKSEIMIGETVDLTAKVVPVDADVQTVAYQSKDVGVVTVNSSGQIKGVGVGSTTVVLKADKIEKEIGVKVLGAKTASIILNKEALVLQPRESFKIVGNVTPKDAIQSLSFKSGNVNVATVSDQGLVNAVSVGSTFVVISNGDMMTSVSVIVDRVSASNSRNSDSGSNSADVLGNVGSASSKEDAVNKTEAVIIDEIRQSDAEIFVKQEECAVITAPMLKALRESGNDLTVTADEYALTIYGSQIVNPVNELSTRIDFVKEDRGVNFVLNDGGRGMPGAISLDLKGENGGKYLYLYNESSGKYQRLTGGKTGSVLKLDEAGKYLLTDEKLNGLTIKMKWVIGAGILIVVGIGVYIVVRRKYLFW